MIVTAGNPNDDPMTRAVAPMAAAAGGEPVVQYEQGKTDFSKQASVIYLGHGEPGGELSGVQADKLIEDLTDTQRGLSSGTQMTFWSCYAAAGPTEKDSLLWKVHEALESKKIAGVSVSGIPGALYTNTDDGKLYSGPEKTDKKKRPAELDVITSIEIAVWLDTGLCVRPVNVVLPDKTVKIGDNEYTYQERKVVIPPFTTEMALGNLLEDGKIDKIPAETETQAEIIAKAMRGWYKDFFGRPIIKAYMETGVIAPWDKVVVSYVTK
jgi:hypothetical protein